MEYACHPLDKRVDYGSILSVPITILHIYYLKGVRAVSDLLHPALCPFKLLKPV